MNNESTINRVANVSLPPQLAELAADNVTFMICVHNTCLQFPVVGRRRWMDTRPYQRRYLTWRLSARSAEVVALSLSPVEQQSMPVSSLCSSQDLNRLMFSVKLCAKNEASSVSQPCNYVHLLL